LLFKSFRNWKAGAETARDLKDQEKTARYKASALYALNIMRRYFDVWVSVDQLFLSLLFEIILGFKENLSWQKKSEER
jgi:hypothetical protein